MNNTVRDYRGRVVGFRCFSCGEIYPSMWGTTCNKCSEEEKRHSQLIDEITKLRKELKQGLNK